MYARFLVAHRSNDQMLKNTNDRFSRDSWKLESILKGSFDNQKAAHMQRERIVAIAELKTKINISGFAPSSSRCGQYHWLSL